MTNAAAKQSVQDRLTRIPWSSSIALLSLFVAAVSLYFQTRGDIRQITCEVLQADELTRLASVPELDTSFLYRGQPVKHFWKVSLRCVNSGDVTVVGQGVQKTLISDSLSLRFSPDASILDATFDRNDVNSRVAVSPASTINLTFDQWKRGEIVALTVYASRSSGTGEFPLPAAPRDLIDGDIVVTASLRDATPVTTWFERRPIVIRAIVNICSFLVIAAVTLVGGIVLPLMFVDYVRFRRWKRRYWSAFEQHVQSISGWTAENKKAALANPKGLGEDFWTSFKGVRLRSDSNFDSWRQAVMIAGIGLVSAGILSVRVVADLMSVWRWYWM